MKTMRNASKGFTLASAVFLLVIIAALGHSHPSLNPNGMNETQPAKP